MSTQSESPEAAFDAIIEHGNRFRYRSNEQHRDGANWFSTGDGSRISVIAGWGTYCSPRPGPLGGVPEDYEGPFTSVEATTTPVRSAWTNCARGSLRTAGWSLARLSRKTTVTLRYQRKPRPRRRAMNMSDEQYVTCPHCHCVEPVEGHHQDCPNAPRGRAWDCDERGHLPLFDGTCQSCGKSGHGSPSTSR